MAYGLRVHAPVAVEIRRTVRRQLKRAIGELGVGVGPNDGTIHDARRRIKKARAALRLGRDAMQSSYRKANRRLRRATRLLAAIADGEALLRTFDAIARQHRPELTTGAIDGVRRYLIARQSETDRRAIHHRLLQRVAAALARERRRAKHYEIEATGFPAVASGFARTVKRSQTAMGRSQRHPEDRRFHTWRQRVKDHWLQVRLLNARCGSRLAPEAARLAQLDAALGACHDLALLSDVISHHAPLTRADAAACLRLIRRAQWVHRHEAFALGAEVYAKPASSVVMGVASMWTRSGRREECDGRLPTRRAA